VLQIPHDRFAYTGKLRQLGLGYSGFPSVALDQLGQGDHCCFSSNKSNKTDFSRPNDLIVNNFYRLRGVN
jgi:hypothetical protein